MDLDRHKLQEEREWRFRNYQSAVRRTVQTLIDAIQTESKSAIERDITYDDDARGQYSYIDQASAIEHAILQAVNNADFRGLTRDAGDLHAVEMAIHSLAKLQAELPPAMVAELTAAENEALADRIDQKVARFEEVEARDRDGCQAAVHQTGRGVGFNRCQNKGKFTFTVDGRPGYLGTKVEPTEADAIEVKVCGTHAKEFAQRGRIHVYTPDDWTAKQHALYRKKETEEIGRMQARLQAALGTPEPLKEIEG